MDGCICNRAEQKDGRDVCACVYERVRLRENRREMRNGRGRTHK